MRPESCSLFLQLVICILIVEICKFRVSGIKLDPVLFTNNRIYALLNQHAGNYLTAGKDGETPYRSSDTGSHSEDQLWKVKAISKEGFELVPINGESVLQTIWKPIYLGYGKYHLRNVDKDTCLDASTMTKVETPCSKDNLSQEWFPILKDQMKS